MLRAARTEMALVLVLPIADCRSDGGVVPMATLGGLVALLTAEVAPGARLLRRHDADLAALGGDGAAIRDHVPGQRDAASADEHPRAGDQLARLVLGFTAERAGQ